MRSTVARLVLLALIVAAPACYTKLRTEPQDRGRRTSEPPPHWPPPPKQPAPEVAQVEEPADTLWARSIDGDYKGYSLVVDASGHRMGDLHCVFQAGTYHCQVKDLPEREGTYTLGPNEIVLRESAARDSARDWTLAPEGHYALQRVGDAMQLVRRDAAVYREISLSPQGPDR